MDPLRLAALQDAFAVQAYDIIMLLTIAFGIRHNLVNSRGFVLVSYRCV